MLLSYEYISFTYNGRIKYGSTKQFHFNLLLYHVYSWSDVYVHNALYCSYVQNARPKNKVRFYVARDENDELFLYMGKPFRGINKFHPYQNGCIITSDDDLSNFGLNKDDYANLKWEDEPVEVFINMED